MSDDTSGPRFEPIPLPPMDGAIPDGTWPVLWMTLEEIRERYGDGFTHPDDSPGVDCD